MNNTWTVNWIRPDGDVVDVTAVTLLDQIGSLNRGIAPPDELFAYISGDFALAFDNQDGFFTGELESDPSDDQKFNDISSLFQVDVFRDGRRMFRGYMLPEALKLKQLDKTAEITVLGPMRLADTKSAAVIKRQFPVNLQLDANSAKDGTAITLNVSVSLEIGDVIAIGFEQDITATISGWDSSSRVATLVDPLPRDVADGEPVVVTTPFPRNRTLTFLVQTLFFAAGVIQTDIRFTGIVGSRPFLSSFNTIGTSGFGELKGLRHIQVSAIDLNVRLIAAFEQPGILTLTQRRASSAASGFVAHATTVVDRESAGTHDFSQQGGLAGEPVKGQLTTNQFLKPNDFISVGGYGLNSHPVNKKAYTIVQTIAGSTFLYEVHLNQGTQDVNVAMGGGNVPDYEFGGRSYSLRLKRYTTGDGGATWTQDTAFVPAFAAPGLVPAPVGTSTYSYVVVAKLANPDPAPKMLTLTVSVSNVGTTNIGPNPALGGGRTITVTWTAVSGASEYWVYRTVTGNGETTGRVAVIAAPTVTFIDNGAIGNGLLPELQFELLLVQDTSFVGTGGGAHDLVISGMPQLQGSGYDHVLYIGGWYGGVTTPDLRNERIRINGGKPAAETYIHLNAGSCRAMFTRSFASFTALNVRTDFYFWDRSPGGTPAIVHCEDTGIAHTCLQAMYITGSNPIIRGFRWNQIDGVGARVFGLFSHPNVGTGYLILTPGDSIYTGTVEGLFIIEATGVIDALKATLVDNFAQNPARNIQVCTDLSISEVSTPDPENMTIVSHISPWTITIGVSGPNTVMVGYAADRWFIVSRFATDFVSYADFEGLSISQALQELGFLVNAFVNVEFGAPFFPNDPYGSFVSRDLPAPTAPKLLENLDGTKPAGAVQPLILSRDIDRAWEQTRPFVRVKGPTDDILGEAGPVNLEQDGLEIEARLVSTKDFAQVLAETHWRYYGPAYNSFAAPVVAFLGSPQGTTVYRYLIVANTNALDPRVGIIAISGLGESRISSDPLTVPNKNQLTWPLVTGATFYHVFRILSTATVGGSATVGSLGSTAATTFDDTGATVVLNFPTPTGLRQTRQAGTIEVMDDGTIYLPRSEVQFPDDLGHTDLGEPTEIPPVPPDPTMPPRWWIENMDFNPTDPVITLQVVEKDVP
jgi:hypothetical protein